MLAPYAPPRSAHPIDLKLDANEGRRPPAELLSSITDISPDLLRRYPSTLAIERSLADRLGVAPEQVAVTAGGDDALDRLCRAFLTPGSRALMTTPTFEMIPRYAAAARAKCLEVRWESGPFPTAAFIAARRRNPPLSFIVSPNNPTGAAATADDIASIARAAPELPLCVDLAYTEYADADLTPTALAEPNVVIVRTLSKAWGLAGLRVGYAVGPEALISRVRSASGPYPVSGASLAIAAAWLERGETFMRETVGITRRERTALRTLLGDLGVQTVASQANFVLARFPDAWRTADRLAERAIGVRRFPRPGPLADALRITCPCDDASFDRLAAALRDVFTTELPS
jgi:histidinol-phosphate aminotransferase